MQSKAHWEQVYATKPVTGVSWYKQHLDISLQIIARTEISKTAQIIDVGGGASTLVDDLLDQGFQNIAVLDISSAALAAAQQRLGQRATSVKWIEADVTEIELPPQSFDLWHDRAVFHFLTDETARHKYINNVRRALKPGGHIIVASFGVNGPTKCSGLEVVRYNCDQLHHEFGADFELIHSLDETHQTPSGAAQEFVYCYCRKL